MNILHISNDFIGSKVHVSLYKELAKQGVKQTIYCPVRKASLKGRNSFEAEGTKVVYDFVIKPYHRYLYHIKRHDIFCSLQKKVDLSEIDLCHAATLLTDGGQAYKIYKRYHIPYIVALRNSDINGFLDRAPNTWLAAWKILSNAKKIVFISQALMDKFSNHKVIKPILPSIEGKMVLIPNGIDNYFLDHLEQGLEERPGHKVLYVGNFSHNKNVMRLCEAILRLSKEDEFSDIKLTLVGGGGRDADENVSRWIEIHKDVADFIGPIYEKEKLCEIFRKHNVFAMPSIHETFGLVYIEALSQNLPVLFTKGQGIDGLFLSSIGEAVNPLSVEQIKAGLITILRNKTGYSNEGVDFDMFRWNKIASKYIHIYNKITSEK